MINNDFTIIVDTREQKPWEFSEYSTAHQKLDTGDYSIQGFENIVAIERKRNVAEIANNITESRFEDVINRLKQIKYPFILLEFNLQSVLQYPIGSSIPKRLWSKIKISPNYIIKHLIDLQIEHNINVIFCGDSDNAEHMATSILKRIYKIEQNNKDQNNV
jgi:ERCC4-type nuclease